MTAPLPSPTTSSATASTLTTTPAPPPSTPSLLGKASYRQLCDAVYQHVYDAYYGQGRSVYGMIGQEAGAFRYG